MSNSSGMPSRRVVIESALDDPTLQFAQEVESGLRERPMRLPCRFLYDDRGSELFEQICDLPEYYLTRTEASILKRHSNAVREATGPVTLIELGSGTSVKTDYLLTAYSGMDGAIKYVPVDVSEFAIRLAADVIMERHPTVEVEGIVGTYETAFPLFREHSPSMVLFLGSTIGNFDQSEADEFWRQIRDNLEHGDFFLLGADLVKDKSVLEAAYDDAAGVTAEFMRNLFARMNRELGADIGLDQIEHVAEFNEDERQVEMYARFKSDQEIFIEPLDQSIFVSAGDSVLLELSRKFVLDDLIDYVSGFGFDTVRVFTDERDYFANLLLRKR